MGLIFSRFRNHEKQRPTLTREEEEIKLWYKNISSNNANRTEEESCCITCTCETTRRERTKLERLALKENQQGGGGGEEGEGEGESGGGVDLHPCNIQVVITVNTPLNFKLSFDFLPCFGRTQEKQDQPGFDYYKFGWIAGASNGLLLCSTGKFSQIEYYITNPLTKQWVALPPAPRIHSYVHIGFIFDPCTNYSDQAKFPANAQAYHEPLRCNSCKFKVVRFYDEYQCHQFRSQFEVESFSSDAGQWTIATVSSPKAFYWNSDRYSPSSFFHNGCLHWVSRGGSRLVVYDPYNNEIRGTIHGPKRTQVCQSQSHVSNIGFSRGSFWLSQVSPTSGYLRFWELKGYDVIDDDTGGGKLDLDKCYWRPHRLCNLSEMKGGPKWVRKEYFDKVVSFHPRDPDIVYFQLKCSWNANTCVVSCNLRTKTLGRAILEHHGFRFRGDIFTLVLPARSALIP